MTTTIAELEATLPEAEDPFSGLLGRVDDALNRLVLTARAQARARHALNGERAGHELDARLRAYQAATMAHHQAQDEALAAEGALEAAARRASSQEDQP